MNRRRVEDCRLLVPESDMIDYLKREFENATITITLFTSQFSENSREERVLQSSEKTGECHLLR
jgi:hypothetical protein